MDKFIKLRRIIFSDELETEWEDYENELEEWEKRKADLGIIEDKPEPPAEIKDSSELDYTVSDYFVKYSKIADITKSKDDFTLLTIIKGASGDSIICVEGTMQEVHDQVMEQMNS